MGTTKIITILNRDALNWPVITWQTNASEKKDLVMPDVSSVAEITLPIIRYVRSTKSYKRNLTHISVWNNILLPHK
jgi:hypothetical protein